MDLTFVAAGARDGRVVERRDYVVAVFETGELFVPALSFAYVTARRRLGRGPERLARGEH